MKGHIKCIRHDTISWKAALIGVQIWQFKNPSIPVTLPKWVRYVTGTAFQHLYLYLSNLWAGYCRFTRTCATPYSYLCTALTLRHFSLLGYLVVEGQHCVWQILVLLFMLKMINVAVNNI
jgi:hypothetical protein